MKEKDIDITLNRMCVYCVSDNIIRVLYIIYTDTEEKERDNRELAGVGENRTTHTHTRTRRLTLDCRYVIIIMKERTK